MFSPVTNCSPIISMAIFTPLRMTGSPARLIRPVSEAMSVSSPAGFTNAPDMTRPHVAAFTNKERSSPKCARQSPRPILSRIKASRVALSGTRSRASAKHISAVPSSLESEYSLTNPSTPPRCPLALRRATRSVAVPAIFARVSAGRRAASSSGASASCSRMR